MADREQESKPSDPDWERDVIARLANAGLVEQRRARRWGIFFKFLTFGYLLLLLFLFGGFGLGGGDGGDGQHTALVDLQGIILEGEPADADYVVAGLRAAFEDSGTAGVILRINSPGGSPVQSGYINDEIGRLRALYPNTPLYVVISDICASGGLYVAVAAERIYANKASIVGSIGVRMDSFGLVEAIDKLGIERRLLTAGENKGLLDPFLPLDQGEKAHIQALLDEVHAQFINEVKEGRGERLANDNKLFSGLVWTGEQALELGLVDALGSPSFVAREVIGAEEIVDFTYRPAFFERFAERIGTAFAQRVYTRAFVPRLY